MGTWGSKLYDNDVAMDVKDEFLNHLKCGRDEFEATELMIKENQEMISDYDDGVIFWLTLADTQWNYGRLLPIVKEEALKILNDKDEKKSFENIIIGRNEKRKKVIQEFREKINSPIPEKKKIKLYKYFKTTWKHGDTFSYEIDTDYSKELDLYGHHLIFYTLHHDFVTKGEDGDFFPIVYIKITSNMKRPGNIEELNSCSFVKTGKFKKSGLSSFRRLVFTSSRIKLKKLDYIGNFVIEYPDNERFDNRFLIKDSKTKYEDGYFGSRYFPTSFIDLSKTNINSILDDFLKPTIFFL